MTKSDLCDMILKLVEMNYKKYAGNNVSDMHCDIIKNFISHRKYNSVFVYIDCIVDIDNVQELNVMSRKVREDIDNLRKQTNWNNETIAAHIGKDIDDGKYDNYIRGNVQWLV